MVFPHVPVVDLVLCGLCSPAQGLLNLSNFAKFAGEDWKWWV